MTLRTDIVWLDLDDTPEEMKRQIINSAPHSRLPVCQGSLDHILGVVHTKDLLVQSLAEQRIDLAVAMQEPVFAPESIRALDVLELFKQSGNHMALVVDEFGSIQGLVTLHDILEAVVGDVSAAGEAVEPRAVQRDDGSWLLDGLLPVDEFRERFHLEPLPGEQQGACQTLGGFVMTQLGRIPAVADHFVWGDRRFEVVDMDGHRVDKVLVTPMTPGSAPEPYQA
jgi:putative hemolysin